MREFNAFSMLSSKKRREIVLWLSENGPSTRDEISEGTNINLAYLNKLLVELNNANVMERKVHDGVYLSIKPQYIEILKEIITFPDFCIENFGLHRRVPIFKYILEAKYNKEQIISMIEGSSKTHVSMVITRAIKAGYVKDFETYLAIAEDKKKLIERCIEISEYDV